MTQDELIHCIKTHASDINFDDVINTINTYYHYTPARFTNGKDNDIVINEAGSNEGSCKIFSFAILAGLSENETLACFGEFYRVDVLSHPQGTNHANIRTYIRHGWSGIKFDTTALEPAVTGSFK